MSDSREDSPDWLRSFSAPALPVVTLSSSSESSPNVSEDRENENEPSAMDEDGESRQIEVASLKKTSKSKSPAKRPKADQTSATKKKKRTLSDYVGDKTDTIVEKKAKSEKDIEPSEKNSSLWALSSDSESPSNSPIRDVRKGKSPKKEKQTDDPIPEKKTRESNNVIKKEKNNGDIEVPEEVVADKSSKSQFSSSRLPLVVSDKVNRTKALVECEGESIDLSGDVGAVGRVAVRDDPSGDRDLLLDLKGTIYKTTIIPSRTFCVVSFGPSEAKIEAIMNDFILLKPESNVYEAETMVEGTLEGYSFDSEDEADKPKTAANQTDQNENDGNEEQPKKKSKTKAEKASGPARKKGKGASSKPPPKKAKKKTQAPKKGKAKK